jgi:anaerobic ribonucleoside-triphosphate reductase activating protein
VALSLPWRVHAVVGRSLANGPGTRMVIWSQGCTLGCVGCFNPATHDPAGPAAVRPVGELVEEALAAVGDIEGVTLTGGEPLEQPEAVAAFCHQLKVRSSLGIIILTGFTRGEIDGDAARSAAAAHADLVVAGRYNARRHLGRGLRGSDNKTYWARTARYRPEDLQGVPDMEIAVAADGTVMVTGMPVAGWEVA